jgi:hypothetical protein
VAALELLLASRSGLGDSASDCLSATLFAAARSPAPGLSRLLVFARRQGARGADLGRQLKSLGFASAPAWVSTAGNVSLIGKAALEEAAGAPEAALVDAALARLSLSDDERGAIFAARNAAGATALEVACAHGRSAALIRWLALRSPRSQRTPSGLSCAHIAAASGEGRIVYALAETRAELTSRDKIGESPCDVAQRRGALARKALSALEYLDACKPSPAQPLSKLLSSRRRALSLPPKWSAGAHAAAHWRRLAPDGLAAIGLPRDLLGNGEGCDDNVVGVGGGLDSRFQLNVRESDDDGLVFALDDLPLDAFLPVDPGSDKAARQAALRRLHFDLGMPFVVRALPSDSTTPIFSRESLLAQFGDAEVHSGPIPYADEYGVDGEIKAPLREFIRDHMGSSEDNGCSGPGANNDAPPLVFDAAALLRGGPATSLATLYARRLAAAFPRAANASAFSLSQLIIGPPGSGSAQHYHPAAINVALFGLKLWSIVPPADSAFADAAASEFWRGGGAALHPHFEVLQGPGDIVFVPATWGHAVVNVCDSLALAFQI